MTLAPPDLDLVEHLQRTNAMTPVQAAKVAAELLAYYDETTEEFVRRRHRELQATGGRNPEIFAAIAAELAGRRVAPPQLTARQLRRLVYG